MASWSLEFWAAGCFKTCKDRLRQSIQPKETAPIDLCRKTNLQIYFKHHPCFEVPVTSCRCSGSIPICNVIAAFTNEESLYEYKAYMRKRQRDGSDGMQACRSEAIFTLTASEAEDGILGIGILGGGLL